MKTWKEITAGELAMMASHHRKCEYNQHEIAEVYNFVREYIDPHQGSCTSCGNSLREAKDKMNSYYLQWRDAVRENVENGLLEQAKQLDNESKAVESEGIVELKEAKSQTKKYKNGKGKTNT